MKPTDQNVKAVEFITETAASLDDDGTWKAISKTTERAQTLDGEWREEFVESMCIDDSLTKAIETATKAILSFIIENVYSAGFTGLIEYYDFIKKDSDKTQDKKKKPNDS